MQDGRAVELVGIEHDPDPSPIAGSMIGALEDPSRIAAPMARASFLEKGHLAGGKGRGVDPFIELEWPEAIDLAARELQRVRSQHGNSAIYGGSYGWGSAGRFHHAKSQVHRFLNAIGGCVRSVQDYSFAAASTILPYVIGTTHGLGTGHTVWPSIINNTQTVVMFGGAPHKNAQVNSGGVFAHYLISSMKQLRKNAPHFDDFWEKGLLHFPEPEVHTVLLEDFRRDPQKNPLQTASGLIEIYSETIAGYGYADCSGHPKWFEPLEWLGSAITRRFPLHMISNQPKTRLHSQYDNGQYSRDSKIQGREPVRINPDDASKRGIGNGDVVRIFNDRGECLAGVILSDAVRPGVVQLSTGAWYDPQHPGQKNSLDKHGNPNVLTADRGTSKLSQATSAHSCLVEIELFTGTLPPLSAFDPPRIVSA